MMHYAYQNPRLTITLEPSLAAQLRTLSELTGNSQSSLIAELLQGSGPVFDRLIQVLQAAKTAKEAMRGKLVADMEDAQSKMEGAFGIAMEGFDQLTGSLLDEAEAATRRARKGALKGEGSGRGAAAPTPISNRGVRLDPLATKDIAQSRVKVRRAPVKRTSKIRG